jgi:hypothetical protein
VFNHSKKLTAIFLIFLLVFTLFNQSLCSNVVAQQPDDEVDEPKIGVLGRIVKLFGTLATALVPIFRLSVVAVRAEPPYIEIGYNETKTIDIGLWDVEGNTGFEVWDKESAIFIKRFINFEVLEYPAGTQPDAWLITYDPYTINVEFGQKLKSEVSITLDKPPINGKQIQSGILKIRLLDTWGYGNLYFPPEGSPQDKFPNKYLWFMSAVFLMGFGKYSGTVEELYEDIDILVKIKPFHAVRFDTSSTVYLKPNEITSIPITVQNLGNYNDTYGFRIKSENEELKLASPYYITLAPGEEIETFLGVSAPQSVFDYGTLHEIVIEAYSVDTVNETIAERQVLVETRGIYVNEASGIGLISFFLLLFLLIAYIIHKRRKRRQKICPKPKKPWQIKEEKEYLDKLAKKDKEKYEEVINMMQDEYKSALLWYNDFYKSLTQTKKQKMKKIKIKEKPKKEKPKKQELEEPKAKPIKVNKEQKPEIKEVEKEKPEEKPSDREIKRVKLQKRKEAEELKKQRVINRIKKEQEKQKMREEL